MSEELDCDWHTVSKEANRWGRPCWKRTGIGWGGWRLWGWIKPWFLRQRDGQPIVRVCRRVQETGSLPLGGRLPGVLGCVKRFIYRVIW